MRKNKITAELVKLDDGVYVIKEEYTVLFGLLKRVRFISRNCGYYYTKPGDIIDYCVYKEVHLVEALQRVNARNALYNLLESKGDNNE